MPFLENVSQVLLSAMIFLTAVGDGPAVGGVDQESALAVVNDVFRPAVMGGDNRQTGGRRFEQRESEGFGQGSIDKDAPSFGGDPVEFGHLVLEVVLFRNRHFTVKIELVHQQQHVGKNIPLIFLHLLDIFAKPGKNGQVGHGLQFQVMAVGLDQPRDVLALVRPTEGEDKRAVRMHEETVEFLKHRGPGVHSLLALLGLRQQVMIEGVELVDVQAGGDDAELRNLPVAVHSVLLFDFLAGARYDQVGAFKDIFFSVDPLVDLVLPDDVALGHAFVEQFLFFTPPQRVSGVNERYSEKARQLHGNVAGIRIVTVHQVRNGVFALDKLDGLVGVLV